VTANLVPIGAVLVPLAATKLTESRGPARHRSRRAASRPPEGFFSGSHGSYTSPQAYVDGLVPAIWVGVGVLALGALIAAVLPFSTRESANANAAAEATGVEGVTPDTAPYAVAEVGHEAGVEHGGRGSDVVGSAVAAA
jgi:hypothetical protein